VASLTKMEGSKEAASVEEASKTTEVIAVAEVDEVALVCTKGAVITSRRTGMEIIKVRWGTVDKTSTTTCNNGISDHKTINRCSRNYSKSNRRRLSYLKNVNS
jgi:flavin-binding protein dodecin